MLAVKKLNQFGDTIIEVMLVLAVLGLAMTISYATVNRALLQAREAQENSEASSLVQTQFEKLRTVFPNTDFIGGTPPVPEPFCIDDTNQVKDASDPFCSSFHPGYGLSIKIYYCTSPAAASIGACIGHTQDDTFYISATWDNVQGEGTDEVSSSYRLHK